MGEVQVVFSENSLKNASRRSESPHARGLLKVYPEFVELIKILPYRRTIVVKPRDLCIYMGICDHGKLTWIGILLSFLEKQGLAKRHNNSRPRRYRLSQQFTLIKQICRINEQDEDYCVETGCSLLGICPYWVLKQWR
ncbi:MAG: hypothetical protein QXT64_02305 [Desulfurococcaceae archaeon]